MAFIDSSRPRASVFSAIPEPLTLGDEAMEQGIEEQGEAEREPVPEDDYESDKDRLVAWTEDHNLARHLERSVLDAIGALVVREYQIDVQSRSEWTSEAKDALKFATQETEEKQYPWPQASNIIYPLLTTAAFQFSAMTYPAIMGHRNVAKGEVWGSDDGTPQTKDGKPDGAPLLDDNNQVMWLTPPGDKQRRADLVGEHMSWQLLEDMPEWEPQTDVGLMQMAVVGGFVRKTYRDPIAKQSRSLMVGLLDLVWNKNAPSFERAPRHTEILEYYPDEIVEMERADETFLPYLYGPGNSTDMDGDGHDANDTLAPLRFLEQHRRYDLDEDGYAEPLIITVHEQSQRVVRIVARYQPEDIEDDEATGDILRIVPTDYYTLYPFLPNPKGGSIPVGFGHLLKPLNEAINTSLNQMFDAGHLQIAGGGFIGTSLSIHSGPTNFQMGEYKPVNNKGQSIRDAIYPLPFPGPSPVLFQLLGFLVNSAKEVASIQNILSGDAGMANVQPTTLLALIEQGMRLYTAIYKRIFRSLKAELKKLYALNHRYMEQTERFKRGDAWLAITKEDYRLSGGVCPAADPNMVTDMQKITRAMILANYQNDPLCNPMEIRRRLFEAARIEHVDKVLNSAPPPPDPAKQMEVANLQADLGRKRAAEQKDATQAILNLSLARKTVQESEIAPLEALTEQIRVHLEAVNSTIKAADVDAKFHGHNVRMKQAQQDASDAGNKLKNPAPTGPAAVQPDISGNVANQLSGMAPPAGNQGGAGLPLPSGGQLPPGPPAGVGGAP